MQPLMRKVRALITASGVAMATTLACAADIVELINTLPPPGTSEALPSYFPAQKARF